ncbi:hypothetical protein ACVILK_003129 [Bradyrhizobium embrapense]
MAERSEDTPPANLFESRCVAVQRTVVKTLGNSLLAVFDGPAS